MCGYFKEDQRVSLSRLVFFNCFFDQKISRDPTKRHTTLLVTNKEEHAKKNFFFFFFFRARVVFVGALERESRQSARSFVRSFVHARGGLSKITRRFSPSLLKFCHVRSTFFFSLFLLLMKSSISLYYYHAHNLNRQ